MTSALALVLLNSESSYGNEKPLFGEARDAWAGGNAGTKARRPAHASTPSGFGLLAALLALGPLSCGNNGDKPVYPVRGQVFFQGRPTAGALVLFQPVSDSDPKAPRPRGRVDKDGAFTLSTYRANDGAPAGDYVVTIDWRQSVPGRDNSGGPALMPPYYATSEGSPLRATVRPEANQLPPFVIPR